MNSEPLRLGSRKSPMAIAQSGDVARLITERTGRRVEIVGVTTLGDVSREHVTQIGGTGIFVSALRESLLRGEVDLAVHSLKDLPTAPAPGIRLAAVPRRADPRDALVSRGDLRLADLPSGARIGTGSPRRAAQLRRLRPDLDVQPVRGNVDTRLRLVTDGDYDAVVLAVAGLSRLGRSDVISEILEPEVMLPAPGQGALAVECRAADAALADEITAALNDAASRAAVAAERALLGRLEAGCTAPVGALAHVGEGQICLTGAAISPDGGSAVRKTRTAPVDGAEQLGRQLADELLDDGAAGLIGEER